MLERKPSKNSDFSCEVPFLGTNTSDYSADLYFMGMGEEETGAGGEPATWLNGQGSRSRWQQSDRTNSDPAEY